MRDTLLLTISQSGKSPDIVAFQAEAKRAGIPTLAVTNTEDSTRVDVLASFAELSDDIDRVAAQARVEQAQARLAQGDDAGVRAELAKALARTGLDE